MLAEALLTLAAATDDIDLAENLGAARRRPARCARRSRPDDLVGRSRAVSRARFRAGRGLDHDLFARAIEIESTQPSRRVSDRADANYAALLKYADELDAAEDRLTALLEEARATGDLSSVAYVLGHLVPTYLWRGQLARGRGYADEHFEVAVHGELQGHETQARYNLGLVMAYQGQLDEAERILLGVLDAEEHQRVDRPSRPRRPRVRCPVSKRRSRRRPAHRLVA